MHTLIFTSMASGSDDVMLSVCFGQKKMPVTVKRKDKVKNVVVKLAAALNEKEDGLGLLYRGTMLPGESTVGVSRSRKVPSATTH